MKMSVRFAMMSVTLGLLAPATACAAVDCVKLALAVKHATATDPSATLQVIERVIAANPQCACEVVKAAIEGSKADVQLVAAMVQTAATVAPEQMRLISQCAVAVAPDSLPNVQAVMAKFDPNGGKPGSSAKSAKAGPLAQPTSNPLDFPGSGIGDPPVKVGGNPGGPGGFPLLPFGPSIFVPPVINPPETTPVSAPGGLLPFFPITVYLPPVPPVIVPPEIPTPP
jgi:hypothetical protein